jgi:molecular chaperone GrpE (heat shock protein)
VQGGGPDLREAEVIPAEEVPTDGPVSPVGGEELLAGLDRLEDRLGQGFERLLGELKARWALDRFREAQVDKLHAELQEHKRDLLGRAVQPVLQGLVRLHGDLGKTVEALQDKDPKELSPQRFFGVLDGFQEDLELLLERHGVSRFESPGEVFEPARQTALRTEPAPRAELAGRILARIRPGFEQGDVLLRKEGVAVWASPPDPLTETDDPGRAPGQESSDDTEEPK